MFFRLPTCKTGSLKGLMPSKPGGDFKHTVSNTFWNDFTIINLTIISTSALNLFKTAVSCLDCSTFVTLGRSECPEFCSGEVIAQHHCCPFRHAHPLPKSNHALYFYTFLFKRTNVPFSKGAACVITALSQLTLSTNSVTRVVIV